MVRLATRLMARLAICATGMLVTATAHALDAGPVRAAQSTLPAPAPALPASSIGSAVFGFVIVLAVMAGAFWLLRRLQRGGLSGSGPLHLVGSIAVGPKERVVLIECNGAWVLVGAAPGQVTQLHAMPAPEQSASTTVANPGQGSPALGELSPQAFRRWLERAMSKNSGKAD